MPPQPDVERSVSNWKVPAHYSEEERRDTTETTVEPGRGAHEMQTVAETNTSITVHHPTTEMKTMTDSPNHPWGYFQIHHQSDHLLRGALAEITVPALHDNKMDSANASDVV